MFSSKIRLSFHSHAPTGRAPLCVECSRFDLDAGRSNTPS